MNPSLHNAESVVTSRARSAATHCRSSCSSVTSSFTRMSVASDMPENVRLDVWLDVSCLFKTRSEAQGACKLARVAGNGATAKPHRDVRPGDEIVITRPAGRKQAVVVRGLADTHVSKAVARELYEDRTPPPTAEEVEM